ncbi:pentatricopeptide repeat-containing protein [Tanacetum coccineum]
MTTVEIMGEDDHSEDDHNGDAYFRSLIFLCMHFLALVMHVVIELVDTYEFILGDFDNIRRISDILDIPQWAVLFLVKMIHCHVVKLGFCLDVYVLNALIDSSSRCGLVGVGDAKRVFQGTGEGRDMMPVRDMVSWNTILDGYKVGELNDAFERIPERNVVSLGLLCLRGIVRVVIWLRVWCL